MIAETGTSGFTTAETNAGTASLVIGLIDTPKTTTIVIRSDASVKAAALGTGDPASEMLARLAFTSAAVGDFRPNTNELVISDAKTGGGPSGAAFYAIITYTTASTGVAAAMTASPRQYALMQNYPNPFNPSTVISYALPEPAHVTISVFDVLGRGVGKVVDIDKPAGYFKALFDAGGVSAGVYFYRMTAVQARGAVYTQTRRLSVLK